MHSCSFGVTHLPDGTVLIIKETLIAQNQKSNSDQNKKISGPAIKIIAIRIGN